ncbi:MAG: FAD-dependent oxidoreductase, partial [Wenzhouxiangella sp.]
GAWPDELLGRHDDRAFVLRKAGFIRPDRWCAHLMDHPGISLVGAAVHQFAPGCPVVTTLDDGRVFEADLLVLCVAEAARSLPGLDWLPLKLIRGQVSYCAATTASRKWQQAVCHAGYLTPALDDLHCVGATFDLNRQDTAPATADDDANLAQLRAHLPDCWRALGGESAQIVGNRAALRCQSTDFLPLVGPLPDPSSLEALAGIWLNLAHGSRGITHTPLCADLIADQVSGLVPAADPDIVDALAPERFIIRQRRRKPEQKGRSGKNIHTRTL